jgi:AraC-like DNA-binding protein/mannose-6-phosphate isomerase-like protein (cupin superfamily)
MVDYMDRNVKYCHVSRKDKSSFIFDHVHIPWDKQIDLHRQESWELTYIITGRGTRVIGNTIEPFVEGEIILIPPHIPHCWSFDEKVSDERGKIENICIFFGESFLENNKAFFPEMEIVIEGIQKITDAIAYTGQSQKEIQDIMKTMIKQNRIERLASVIRLLALLASAKHTSIVGRPVVEDSKTERLQLLYLYVMNNYPNEINLADVAKFIGMEKSSFCVFFKKATGQSFFSFLTEYRIEASCKMLLNTSRSVAEIGNASGFGDVPYYNRVFKKQKGITPGQYRIQKKG